MTSTYCPETNLPSTNLDLIDFMNIDSIGMSPVLPISLGHYCGNYANNIYYNDSDKYELTKLLDLFRNANSDYFNIKNNYMLINEEKIFGFISAKDSYLEPLLQIPHQLRQFIAYHRLYLELLDEFEENEPPKLRITIIASDQFEKVYFGLKQFNITWFLKEYNPLNYRFVFILHGL